ncbi:MAG: ParA family protein [Desulfosudaceae bacterium]
MAIIAVYNNKGGVGKSTLSVFLADFFASTRIAKKDARVAVVDLDGQSSSATSLLGLHQVAEAKAGKQTIAHMFKNIRARKRETIAPYLLKREKGHTVTRRLPLGELWVMVQERDNAIDLETDCSQRDCLRLVKLMTSALRKKFDIVFIDTPANIDKRNKITLAALRAADYILIPAESSRMAVNAMTDTFNMIQYARGISDSGDPRPVLAGILLNKTDRRTRQYQLHNQELKNLAAQHDTTLFRNYFPTAQTLSSAVDDSIYFPTLREKYATYYDHVRKAAVELAQRCGYTVRKKA